MKKRFVIRIRAEGYQFLCATGSFAAAINWVDALNPAIAVNVDLNERKEPIYQTLASPRTPWTRSLGTKTNVTLTFRQLWSWRKYTINGTWVRDQEGEHSRVGLKRYLEDEERIVVENSAAVRQTCAAHCLCSVCFGSSRTAVSLNSNHSTSTRMDNAVTLDTKEIADYKAWEVDRTGLVWRRLEYAGRCAKTLTLRDFWADGRYLCGGAWVNIPTRKRTPTKPVFGWPGLM